MELAAWQAIAADQPGLEQPRLACSDQLTAERPQQRVIDGGTPHRSHSLEAAGCFADERVARELLQKRRVVVVEREHVAEPWPARPTCRQRSPRPRAARCGAVQPGLWRGSRPPQKPAPGRRHADAASGRWLRARPAPGRTAQPGRSAYVRRPRADTRRGAGEGASPPVGPPGPGVISWLGGARRICK